MKNVLLLEDEPVVNMLCSQLLRKGGFEVLSAQDLETAGKIWNERVNDFDLIVSDCDIYSKKDGWYLFLKDVVGIKTSKTPLVFMSAGIGIGSEDPANKAERLGASVFIRKPFVPGEFLTICKEVAKLSDSVPA